MCQKYLRNDFSWSITLFSLHKFTRFVRNLSVNRKRVLFGEILCKLFNVSRFIDSKGALEPNMCKTRKCSKRGICSVASYIGVFNRERDGLRASLVPGGGAFGLQARLISSVRRAVFSMNSL